jgi:hypothetical protein
LGEGAEILLVKHLWWVAATLCLAACGGPPDRVDARDYDAFWLWAGVEPQPALRDAKAIYVLDGEIGGEPTRYRPLRPQPPSLGKPDVWLVLRVDTLRWQPEHYALLGRKVDAWRAAGNRLAGVQIDFDARTRHLDDYAAFLRDLRARLPRSSRLSITGLMDWSANGDPKTLESLRGIVDEAVIQTYQGRSTIPGYEAYVRKLGGLRIPFRIGLVQGGQWHEPAGLRENPNFRGYVVFLLNPA